MKKSTIEVTSPDVYLKIMLLPIIVAVLLFSCKKNTVPVTPPVLSSDKTITSFSFLKADNPMLADNVQGTINGKNISCTLPSGVSLSALKPTIAHTGSSINPPSGTANNFTAPATYTVTAEDGTIEKYTISVSVAAAMPSVYVVGGQVFSGTYRVRVWKNGIGTSLTDGTYNADGSAVFVKDSILYVAGRQSVGRNLATYWKIQNGIELPTPILNETVNDAYANSIYVSDKNDVYVAGQENYGGGIFIAKVWKNGVAASLSTGNSAAGAFSVFTSGDDVYVSGWESTATGYTAKVWKNGIATTLSPEDGKAYGKAVFVAGGIVYVAGQYWNGSAWVIQVWKNGVPETINNAGSVEVSGMFVSEGDVYIVGSEAGNNLSNAKIWKNGVGTSLSETNGSHAQSVYVYNGDVYVAGWEKNSQDKLVAMLWKNGVGTPLATDAFAGGVMVK